MATATAIAEVTPKGRELPMPEFIEKINDDYKSKIAHVFIVHGNIYDYCDNSGSRQPIVGTFAAEMDDNIARELRARSLDSKGNRGLQDQNPEGTKVKVTRVLATFDLSNGFEFVHKDSKESWMDAMKSHYSEEKVKDWPDNWHEPRGIEGCCMLLSRWFTASRAAQRENQIKILNAQSTKQEILLTVLFTDADALFPQGDIAQLYADRVPIVHVRSWARDSQLGDRNRIILMTRHLTELHESLRGGGTGISTILIPKPNFSDRKQWLENFSKSIEQKVAAIEKRTKGSGMIIGNNKVTKVNLAADFDLHQFAVQSAGMSRKQMEFVIMKSWLTNEPVDFRLVREQKQRALEDEYQGIVDFYEPEHGFEHIGGHEHLKTYFLRKVIMPLRKGNVRTCTSGMLMTGPPGTGKTAIAKCLAKEAKMNFMIGHLDKLFGGLVGETEMKTRKFLEAVDSAAPVIVFLDELDSILSSGRSSSGDSGTSARVFNAIMTWLSDESRKGRVVVIGASNRPDLLDSALIRSGRFDAKIPTLPPSKKDVKGRLAILAALARKLELKFAKAVSETEKDPNNGLGLLLYDEKHIWTGAEVEVVLKKALDNAEYADRKKANGDPDFSLTVEDWNQAFRAIIPNTEEVERMTKLSLLYVDDLDYCPQEYHALATNKGALREELGISAKGELDD